MACYCFPSCHGLLLLLTVYLRAYVSFVFLCLETCFFSAFEHPRSDALAAISYTIQYAITLLCMLGSFRSGSGGRSAVCASARDAETSRFRLFHPVRVERTNSAR